MEGGRDAISKLQGSGAVALNGGGNGHGIPDKAQQEKRATDRDK